MSIWKKSNDADKESDASRSASGPADSQDYMFISPADTNHPKKQEHIQMQEDLITPENLTPELIASIFDAALMDAKLDSDGEIMVQDDVKIRVIPNKERKDRIRFLAVFGFKSSAKLPDRLQCVNLINSEYIMVCASAEKDFLFFRYDLFLGGGVTKKALVLALKRFASIPKAAVADHGNGIVD